MWSFQICHPRFGKSQGGKSIAHWDGRLPEYQPDRAPFFFRLSKDCRDLPGGQPFALTTSAVH